VKKQKPTKCEQLEKQCLVVYRQYNELNRHLKILAVYLWHASEETPGKSQQFHVGQAIGELSHVRQESWNLRVKLEETAMLTKRRQGEGLNEQMNEEVEACR
jgi:hypothetical protein